MWPAALNAYRWAGVVVCRGSGRGCWAVGHSGGTIHAQNSERAILSEVTTRMDPRPARSMPEIVLAINHSQVCSTTSSSYLPYYQE
jgi:hypothetical protein